MTDRYARWEDQLAAFRVFGMMFDNGFRLRDYVEAA